jgi:uncharacterized membrane protein YphA (DoxX/SURF4 family)
MSRDRRILSITVLHVVLGAVLLLGGCLEVAPARSAAIAAHALPPAWARLTIAWSEIVAAVLFLIPARARVGAFLLLAVLLAAAVIHLAHGQNPAALLVYAVGVWVVLTHRGGRGEPVSPGGALDGGGGAMPGGAVV